MVAGGTVPEAEDAFHPSVTYTELFESVKSAEKGLHGLVAAPRLQVLPDL